MQLQIRKATIQDAEQLSQLLSELVYEPSNLSALTKQLEKIAQTPHYQLTVACDGDTIAGTATGIVCWDTCGACQNFLVIENVVTAPAYRGKGVGRAIFHWLEDWARTQDCEYAILVSTHTRIDAHAFYREIGYTQECGFKKLLD